MTQERLDILNKASEKLKHYQKAVIIADGGMEQVRNRQYPSYVADAMRTGLNQQQQLHVASLVLSFVEANERKVRDRFEKL